ncbi:MAG: DUF309 domain-containing protein [Nitrososphaerales archaeon]
MARYIVHLRNNGFSSRKASELLLQARNLVDDKAIIRDSRISSKYIEFDITVESDELENILTNLSSISQIASVTEIKDKEMQKEKAIEYAKLLFNDERYWECHEVLEGVWKKEGGGEKSLLQGIILTCAAFVHSQKDENDVCLSILHRAIEKLQVANGTYYGIDVDRLKELVRSIIDVKSVTHFKV